MHLIGRTSLGHFCVRRTGGRIIVMRLMNSRLTFCIRSTPFSTLLFFFLNDPPPTDFSSLPLPAPFPLSPSCPPHVRGRGNFFPPLDPCLPLHRRRRLSRGKRRRLLASRSHRRDAETCAP